MAKRTVNTAFWIIIGLVSCAAVLGLSSYLAARRLLSPSYSPKIFSSSGAELAVLNIEGVIFDPKEVFESLDAIEEDSAIKALIVRINSPGGAVAPTQEIYKRLIDLREKIPVICSLGDIAASGGYYIASACQTVFTNAGTLTGSIGVIMQFMNLGDLYHWAKMKPLTIKAGKFKDVGSPFREMTPDEKDFLQRLIDKIHLQFKGDIAKGRKIPKESIENYTDGRIFSGEEAIQYGFADKIGGRQDAIKHAIEVAHLKAKPEIIEYPEIKSKFSSIFESRFQNVFDKIPVLKHLSKDSPLKAGVPYFLPSYMLEQIQ